MSRKKGPAIDENVTLNLVPMVDIMFLLLLFFMLGADMGHRELEDVKLPLADTVTEDKNPEGRTTVNAYHVTPPHGPYCAVFAAAAKGGEDKICRDTAHWKIGIRGIDYPLDGSKAREDGLTLKDRLYQEAESNRPDPNNKLLSERRLMIRGDEAGPYGTVQKVMNTCAEVGIYKIEIGAARPVQ
ncbi:MAG: biopolymer transporter ExbD [Planctomycetes bacterium]|nr:biopolymer transporter ExbD [Planctomycetota bacterium]